MKILVTGSQGYVGTRLCEQLINTNEIELMGIDAGFYSETRLDSSIDRYHTMKKDIRDIQNEDLQHVDVVVHLAALSNDPLGEFNSDLTNEINYLATVTLAQLAKKNGCRKFIFLSTQSVYGISKLQTPVTEDGPTNPQTEYARTKLKAEKAIMELNSDNFQVYVLRPATVFGYSSRFRSDIVFNNLLASAYFKGSIEILSDGTPWRPVLFIDDLVNVICYIIDSNDATISGFPINVGLPGTNLQVKDIAAAAQKCCPSATIKYSDKSSRDERSYQVDFSLLSSLFPSNIIPRTTLEQGGQAMLSKWIELKLGLEEFISSKTIRLAKLKELQEKGAIDSQLRFSTEL